MGKKDDKEKGSKSRKGLKTRKESAETHDERGPAPDAPPQEVEAEPFDPARDPGPTFNVPPGTGSASDGEGSGSFEDNLWPTLCHLSPLVGWAFAFTGFGTILMPFLWIALPLIVWQTQKSDPRVEEAGREVVNFQLNVVVLSAILIVTCVLSPFGLLLPVAAIGLSLFAALQASEGRSYRYPFIYRVVRD